MDAYVSTFKRIEKKYRLSAQQMERLSLVLAPYIEVDEYGVARIDSLYYDTPDRALIARSLEKPLYKEKLRVRAYGDMSAAACVFVEMKKKYDGVVYKRRVKTSRLAATAWLSGACSYEEAVRAYPLGAAELEGGVVVAPVGKAPAGGAPLADDELAGTAPIDESAHGEAELEELSWSNRQIAREIDAMIARCGGVEPSMLISCNRAAYRTRHGVASDVRVTFDNAIVYRDLHAGEGACGQGTLRGGAACAKAAHAKPEAGSSHATYAASHVAAGGDSHPMVPLLRPGEMLMEVKCAGAMPLWLARALADVHAYPSSFSKYGSAYQHVMAAAVANGAGCNVGAGPDAAARRAIPADPAAGIAGARDSRGGSSASSLHNQLPQQLQETQKLKGVRCA